MSDGVLADLAAALDLVILERLPTGSLNAVPEAPTPGWFLKIVRELVPERPVTLAEALPVLGSFLTDAEAFWERQADGVLEAEPFVIDNGGDESMPIAATAVSTKGRHFLLIQRALGFDERERILQRARERSLEHENVITQIQALRRPFATLAALVSQLASTQLNDLQRERIAGITRQIETLRGVLERLPLAPRAASPKGGSARV